MDNLEALKKAQDEQDKAIAEFKKKYGNLGERDLSVEEKIQYLEDAIFVLQKELRVHTEMFNVIV